MTEAALFVALALVALAFVASAYGAHVLHQFAIYECMNMRDQVGQMMIELCQLRKTVRESGEEQARTQPQPKAAPVEHPADVLGYDAYRRIQINTAHRHYMQQTSKLLPCDLKLVPARAIRDYLGDRRY